MKKSLTLLAAALCFAAAMTNTWNSGARNQSVPCQKSTVAISTYSSISSIIPWIPEDMAGRSYES